MKDLNEKIKLHSRTEVIRDTLILQLKLLIDGLRDLFLMPVALFATIAGLILHKENPGRYLYRLLNYGKISEKWIGLFDEAQKDTMQQPDLQENSLNDLLNKTQSAFESKYIDESKKEKLLSSINNVLDNINTKINPNTKN